MRMRQGGSRDLLHHERGLVVTGGAAHVAGMGWCLIEVYY